ncbi:MAG: ABC transporter permease [Clostridiales bacterium]|nr:ABC transporter permease [Clostridiales bacterium]
MKRKWIVYPYILWMVFFVILPVLLVFLQSIVKINGASYVFTLDNLKRVFEPLYLRVIYRSIKLAMMSTFICLILGYPVAAIIASWDLKHNSSMITWFIIPMWINFLARTYAWVALLEKHGIIESIIKSLGFAPLDLLYTQNAVIVGMVYNFLPFMILPIYSALMKIDRSHIEAASDLGAHPLVVFLKVVLPKSFSGVMSGVNMVFMPALTTFVISRLLGGGQYMLLGNLIEQQFLTTRDWGFGAALSMVLIMFILISMFLMSKYEDEGGEGKIW